MKQEVRKTFHQITPNFLLLTPNFHLHTSNFQLPTSHSHLPTLNNQELLIKLAHTKMPFGKYEGRYLIDLPEYYVVWFKNKGFPKGQLGEQLELVYELKLNGLEELIRNIKIKYPKK